MDQIKEPKVVAVRFVYHGDSRIVDNITIEPGEKILTGFEMRKRGQFSYKIKRYRLAEIEGDLTYIDPPHRSGPRIGR